MRMKAIRFQGSVVLGPCPGCLNWQVDYTDEVALSYTTVPLSRGREVSLGVEVWHEVIEGVLQEHFEECAHLRAFVQDQ